MLYRELTVLGIFVGIKGDRGRNHCVWEGEGRGDGTGFMIISLTEIGGQVGRKGDWSEIVLYRETLNTTHLHVLKICYPHLREV